MLIYDDGDLTFCFGGTPVSREMRMFEEWKNKEKQTMDDELLVCPYCNYPQYCHEPDEISAYCTNTECENCRRTFEYSVTVTREYSSRKMEE